MRSVIKLAWSTGEVVEIDADVFGEWAAHQGPRVSHGRGKPRLAWQITHVPTGLGATCMETTGISKADAVRVAKHLAEALPSLPFSAEELRAGAEELHETGIRDPRFAEMGEAITREIRKALAGPAPPP